MTHWPQKNSIVIALAMTSVCALVSRVDGQIPHSLPPTLRAAQHLQSQSSDAIDSLVQESQQTAARHQWGNDLRDAPTQPTAQPAARRVMPDQAVQPAAYSQSATETSTSNETATQSDQAWDQILRRSAAAAQRPEETTKATKPESSTDKLTTGPSFIDKESAESTAAEEAPGANNTAALIKRISINLMFVLAIAFGVLLLIRQWQKGRSVTPAKAQPEQDTLNVSQVIPLANGASLHVVQGAENKFVVAIDGGGIKSVNVLSASFEDTMTQVETREQRRQAQQSNPQQPMPTQPMPQLARHTASPSLNSIGHDEIDPNEDTTEIDEKLIKLLLQRSPAA